MANDLNLIVKLRDEASQGFQKLQSQIDRFGKQNQSTSQIIQRHMKEMSNSYKNASKEIDKMTKEMEQAKNAQNNLTGSIIKGGIALTGIQIGLQEVGRFLRSSVQETVEYRNALNATTASARAFGLEEQKLTPAVQQLTQDGLLTQADAYRTLASLLATGLNIDQATELITSYKDVAAFGRDTTLSFADAVKNNAEAFLTESSILGNRAGLQENFNQILQMGADQMGKQVDQLTANERAQAKYIGTLMVAERATGNAARMADTFQGSLIRQETTLRDVQRAVGSALSPSIDQLFKAFNEASSAGQGLGFVLKGLGTILVGLSGGVRILTTSFVQMAKAAQAAAKDIANAFKTGQISFENYNRQTQENMLEMVAVVEDVGDSVSEIWNGTGDEIGAVTRANLDWMNENADGAKKMADDIAKEMSRYSESIRKMSMQFDESMRDLVIAHKDKVDRLKEDMSDEDARFKDQLADQKKRFDKSMSDIEKRHGQKTEKILEQIREEKERTAEELDEIKEEYDLMLSDVRRNGENRVAHLQSQLDKEKARQSTANKERIQMLQRMIAEEKVAIEESVQQHESLRDDEINDELAKRDEKISQIEADLKEENDAFKEAVEERKSEYEEETAKLAEEHDKRRSIIEAELNAEREIQKKHAEDFAKFKDAVAEDDISRLKRKNAMERAEEERSHKQRLSDIKRRVEEANSVASGGSAPGATRVNIPESTNKASQTSFSSQPVQTSASSGGFFDRESGGFFAPARAISSVVGSAVDKVANFFGNLPGFAEGGEFEVGGKSGIDQNVVAFRASRGEKVSINTPQQSRGGNVQINAPITFMNTETDVDRLLERLSWQVSKSGLSGSR